MGDFQKEDYGETWGSQRDAARFWPRCVAGGGEKGQQEEAQTGGKGNSQRENKQPSMTAGNAK